jgi:predicted O-linked N-acetylglucosamine transferase (SPINDLY family)
MSKLAEADRAHLEKNFVEAIELYRAVLAQDPGAFEAWYGLASALGSRLQYAEAIAAYRQALALRPRNAGVHLNLGSALSALGYITDAVRNYRIGAAASEPEVRAMSLRNLALIAPGDPALDNAAVLDIRRAWAAQEAAKISSAGTRCTTVPGERLRIAYYGTFFADRNWMKMYMGVLNAHDRDRFEVNLIVDGALPCATSGYRDHESDRIWQVDGVPNAALASHIAAAKIDVLVDLNGYSHTARLPLLLHRPAPLQIALQGMYGTTGFPGVDFLISDEAALPSGEERHYTERIHRVRHTYLAFNVFYETPAVVPPPSLQNGHITFGSLASAYKLTPQTLAVWSQILHAVPTARLLVRNAALDQESNRADLLARFAERQIPAQRLTLLGSAEHLEFLRTYDQIDIALDAFPYNGGTTTAEALWQGVPVLTINGDRWAGRTSRSILAAACLSEWVAPDAPSLVRTAAALAGAELAPARATQRARIAASPACDVVALCRELELLYRSETHRIRASR